MHAAVVMSFEPTGTCPTYCQRDYIHFDISEWPHITDKHDFNDDISVDEVI